MIKKKPWKLIFLLGPFLIAAGLAMAVLSEKWGLLPLILLLSGIVICVFWLVIQSRQTKWWQQQSTQAGTNAIVATLAVLIILGLINFLSTRYHFRADLTETQLFTLAPQSKELVRTLPQTAKVWIFARDQNYQDQELLENYHRQSNNFKFEYIDPQSRPGLAEKFGVKNFGEVYLEFKNKRQLVQTVDENERLSEVRLTNRLQQITTDSTAKVYFLQGHGEHQLTAGKGAVSKAIEGLTDKNFTALPLNLADNPQVPEDATVVIVAGPKRELFPGEVKSLQDYLNRGGNLLLMIDPNTNPKIDSLLKDWGVNLDNRLAIDISGQSLGLGPAAPLVTEYGQHPITKDFGNGISFYPLVRPLEIIPVSGIESTPLLRTKPYPSSWAESDQQSEKLEFNEGKDLKGPLTLGVALKRNLPTQVITTPTTSPSPTISASPTTSPSPTISPSPTTSPSSTASPSSTTSTTPTASPSPTTSPSPKASVSPTTSTTPTVSPSPTISNKESRLVVLGNSDFATDGLFQQQLNGDVFLNSVTWLSQQNQQPLSIRPKEPTNRRITMSTAQANLLTISSLLLLPFIGLAIGAIIWWKRR
jgi:ABC-type uncharacterized transport system involved in gliding motility auxiliary subunit